MLDGDLSSLTLVVSGPAAGDAALDRYKQGDAPVIVLSRGGSYVGHGAWQEERGAWRHVPAEDLNANGQLDDGEDKNQNGRLDQAALHLEGARSISFRPDCISIIETTSYVRTTKISIRMPLTLTDGGIPAGKGSMLRSTLSESSN